MTFGSHTGTSHAVHRSGSCQVSGIANRYTGWEARSWQMTVVFAPRSRAGFRRRPNGCDDTSRRRSISTRPAIPPVNPRGNPWAGQWDSRERRFCHARNLDSIRATCGRSGDTVAALVLMLMDPARTLVDVTKSVETKPNFPPGILLRELPSGRTLGVLLHGAPIGSAPDRSWPPLEPPLGVASAGAFHGMALARVHR